MLPPPPPPPSLRSPATDASSTPQAPVVPESCAAGGLLLELIKHKGAPFNDHWAYFVRSSSSPSVGIVYEATGDVRNGFQRHIRRNHDLNPDPPSVRIPLQWIDATFVDEELMLHEQEPIPVCTFEESLYKVKITEKTLNNATESHHVYNLQTYALPLDRRLLPKADCLLSFSKGICSSIEQLHDGKANKSNLKIVPITFTGDGFVSEDPEKPLPPGTRVPALRLDDTGSDKSI
ncbi:hypothetical protein FCOIX_45 [Fusarium coicis]|nr:hypothetical protein FCOIX_45 [Fusarium coicis]